MVELSRAVEIFDEYNIQANIIYPEGDGAKQVPLQPLGVKVGHILLLPAIVHQISEETLRRFSMGVEIGLWDETRIIKDCYRERK